MLRNELLVSIPSSEKIDPQFHVTLFLFRITFSLLTFFLPSLSLFYSFSLESNPGESEKERHLKGVKTREKRNVMERPLKLVTKMKTYECLPKGKDEEPLFILSLSLSRNFLLFPSKFSSLSLSLEIFFFLSRNFLLFLSKVSSRKFLLKKFRMMEN